MSNPKDSGSALQSARDTLRNIARPVPAGIISTRTVKGTALNYLAWYDAADLMDERAPGWSYTIPTVSEAAGHIYLVARVTVPTSDGPIAREATGSEADEVSGYGDPFSNAESMALRRAFAKFGLARELYQGKGTELRRRAIAAEQAAATFATAEAAIQAAEVAFNPPTLEELQANAEARKLTHTVTKTAGRKAA